LLPFQVDHGRMYYAHSFFMEPSRDGLLSPYQSCYGAVRFSAILRAGSAMAVQFHPEKSHCCGSAFLGGWLKWATGEGFG
jgi:imidazoleglycerol phosphate synthase glutamine amidotransferase subunit HisH